MKHHTMVKKKQHRWSGMTVSLYNINMTPLKMTWWRKQHTKKLQFLIIYSYAVLSMGLCSIKNIRGIVAINDTIWKSYIPTCTHSLHQLLPPFFFSSWLSKWAPYMDSLAETSCKCHVGLRREKNMKHTNTQRVELHVDMLIFSQENSSQIWNLQFFCSSTYQECQPNTDWPRWSAPTWSLMFICVQWCFFLGIDHLWAMWLVWRARKGSS